MFFMVSVLFGTLLSIGAIFIEEFDFNRYEKWSDIAKLIFYSIAENFGYRQLIALVRLKTLFFPNSAGWKSLDRKGFTKHIGEKDCGCPSVGNILDRDRKLV